MIIPVAKLMFFSISGRVKSYKLRLLQEIKVGEKKLDSFVKFFPGINIAFEV
jgi:hypothetical protein